MPEQATAAFRPRKKLVPGDYEYAGPAVLTASELEKALGTRQAGRWRAEYDLLYHLLVTNGNRPTPEAELREAMKLARAHLGSFENRIRRRWKLAGLDLRLALSSPRGPSNHVRQDLVEYQVWRVRKKR